MRSAADPAAQVLVPKLTEFDRRVLRAIPAEGSTRDGRLVDAVDAWRLGYELDELDVAMLVRVARGLERFGLVENLSGWGWRRPTMRRTPLGTATLAKKRGTSC